MLSSFAYMALILLATLIACYLVWRVGKSLRLVAARSFVFPLACFLAFIAAAWFTWVSLVDALSVASATGWVAVFVLVFSVPVLALVSAILLAGPIVLSCNLPAVRDRLRTTPPRAFANIAASAGLIFLIGGLIAFALPYYRTVGRYAKSRTCGTCRPGGARKERRPGTPAAAKPFIG
jgi:Sec-independent protein secretion pathway component TatC